jgi:5'-methylthioadenosine phosphorylase
MFLGCGGTQEEHGMPDDQARAEIGIIGGSGFYEMPGLLDAERIHLHTPFGEPSSVITLGTLHGRRVAFIARHDEGHRIMPAELPSRANLYAMKRLGVTRVIGVSAVGSLREEIEPLHMVVPDQVIDRSSGRINSFFGDGAVAHIGFADPFCPDLSNHLVDAGGAADATVHRGGTLVVINGPAFSTRAESELYRTWGASIIGMTTVPEARLAREAELCYAALALVTDYDVWHEHEADVTAELIVQNLQANVARAREVVSGMVAALGGDRACECGDALGPALITPKDLVPVPTRRRLGLITERYWGEH